MSPLSLKLKAFLLFLVLLSNSPQALSSDLMGDDKEYITRAFDKISNLETNQWVRENAPAFFTKDMNSWDKSWIINALGGISDSQIREGILEQAPKLIMQDMSGCDKAEIIRAFWEISHLDISMWIIKNAPAFFTKDIDSTDRVNIINAFGRLSVDIINAFEEFSENSGKLHAFKTLAMIRQQAPEILAKNWYGHDISFSIWKAAIAIAGS